MSQKRKLDDSNSQACPGPRASEFNVHTVKKLQAAIDRDPEIDLTRQMPIDYTNRLAKYRTSANVIPSTEDKIFAHILMAISWQKSPVDLAELNIPAKKIILDLLSPSNSWISME